MSKQLMMIDDWTLTHCELLVQPTDALADSKRRSDCKYMVVVARQTSLDSLFLQAVNPVLGLYLRNPRILASLSAAAIPSQTCC